MEPHTYALVLVLGFIFAFNDAFAIGANDCANSWATSVGSGSLKLWQATILAGICEFLGAVLLGSSVADTIKNGIIDASATVFKKNPEYLMLLMMCALIGSSTWVLLATKWEMPVSTTHSIIGAIIGGGIAIGSTTVQWGWNNGSGIGAIVTSWFVSPISSALLGSIMFLIIKFGILRWRNSFRLAQLLVPAFFFVTLFLVMLFILYKGAPGVVPKTMTTELSVGIAAAVAGGVAILSVIPGYWIFKFWINRKELEEQRHIAKAAEKRGMTVEEFKASAEGAIINMPVAMQLSQKSQVQLDPAVSLTNLPPLSSVNTMETLPTVNGHKSDSGSSDDAKPKDSDGEGRSRRHRSSERSSRRSRRRQHQDSSASLVGSSAHVVPSKSEAALLAEAAELTSLRTEVARLRAIVDKPPPAVWYLRLARVQWFKKETYSGLGAKIKAGLLHGLTYDVLDYSEQTDVTEMHSRSTIYESRTERLFSCLQVITACFSSFAHGANDIANACGPLAAIWSIWSTGLAASKNAVPIWIFLYCAGALVLGLGIYGYNIMKALGNKLTLLTPSRGFCMELSAATTVLIASKIGMPVSTTHCITGSTTGVGITSNGSFRAVNGKHLAVVFFGWVITLPMAGVVSGLFLALFLYTPSKGPY